MNIIQMIKNVVRYCVLTSLSDDDKKYPIHQISYFGKTADGVAWYPWGFHANPGKSALGLMFVVGGNPESRVFIPGSPEERLDSLLPTPLKEGEVLVFNPLTKSFVHWKEDGTIAVDSQKDVSVNAKANVDITAVNINLVGITDINGTVIDLTGKITGAADVVSGTGKSLNLHTHAQGADSNADTQVETSVPT
jgi:hypothetical protein